MELPETLTAGWPEQLRARRSLLPRALYYADDAPQQLARALLSETEGRRAVVLFDVRTREVAGAQGQSALADAGWTTTELLVPDAEDGSPPICDDRTKAELEQRLPGADVLVAVGSGVVNDLTKWLAVDADVPYAVLGTAASMNGYSAANVAPTIKGIKSLVSARAARFIGAIPQVIAEAPRELTSAGLGDAVAKPVSTADWLLNHELFGEDFSPPIAGIIDDVEPKYLDEPVRLAAGEPSAVQALFEALTFSGCAMTLYGSSRPASGGEHLISHTLDMLSHLDGVAHDLHGRQVGVATILAAALYQEMMAIEQPELHPDAIRFDDSVWRDIAPHVREQFDAKTEQMHKGCARLAEPGQWDRVKQALGPVLREPAVVKRCLEQAGAAHRYEQIGCSRERFLLALRNCSAMRGRFTSIDLAHAVGLLPGRAEELVDQWLS